jgi:hypothetical protein
MNLFKKKAKKEKYTEPVKPDNRVLAEFVTFRVVENWVAVNTDYYGIKLSDSKYRYAVQLAIEEKTKDLMESPAWRCVATEAGCFYTPYISGASTAYKLLFDMLREQHYPKIKNEKS